MSTAWPSGARASSRAFAPPVSCNVGAPDGRLTTPMSFIWTPRLKPVPTALEKASLAAKRLARVPAVVCGREAAFVRSVSVNTLLRNLSPQRSSECWIRSTLHRSEPMPMIMTALSRRHPGLDPVSRCLCKESGIPAFAGMTRWGWSPRAVHQLSHPPHTRVEAGEDRFADEEVADVEFGELRDCGDWDHIVEGE